MNETDSVYPRDEYFVRIERQFGLRKGGPLTLSPRDWQRVERWQAKGVPLAVVLRGINRAFDYCDATPGASPINSLAYCEQHVQDVWSRAKAVDATVGTRQPENPTVRHLRDAATACRQASESGPRDALLKATASLEALAGQCDQLDTDEIDRRARAIRAMLDVELLEAGQSVPLPAFSPWDV